MNGPELVNELRARCPGLPALFVSGHAGDRRAVEEQMGPGSHFLQKPFATRALLERLRECLAGARTPGS